MLQGTHDRVVYASSVLSATTYGITWLDKLNVIIQIMAGLFAIASGAAALHTWWKNRKK